MTFVMTTTQTKEVHSAMQWRSYFVHITVSTNNGYEFSSIETCESRQEMMRKTERASTVHISSDQSDPRRDI